MEIVKNKRKSLLKKTTVKCKNCKSILRITFTDLSRAYDDNVEYVTGYYVGCPCCNSRIDISLKKARRIL